ASSTPPVAPLPARPTARQPPDPSTSSAPPANPFTAAPATSPGGGTPCSPARPTRSLPVTLALAKIQSVCDEGPAHQLRPQRGWCEPGLHGRRRWPRTGPCSLGAVQQSPDGM